MATGQEEGDVAMGDQDATANEEASEPAAAPEEAGEPAEPPGPSPEERVAGADAAKEEGNALLKSGNFSGAVAKYAEGITLSEPLLEKDASDIGEEMKQRGRAVYLALRLNSAQACIKDSCWADAAEHSTRVLSIEKDNAKALYRRGVACANLDTEGRLEQARTDLTHLAQLEPSNREARERLQQVKERLKEVRKREKDRYAEAMKGGLYQENHKKLDRQKLEYEEEVKRRAEAGEDEISWEDWQKKLKTREEDAKKKEKEEREARAKEAAEAEEQRLLDEENERRTGQGLEAFSLEEWRTEKRNAPRKEEVVQMDEAELDDEEKKMLEETKNKGYYHGRLGTVLSDAAPKPQQMAQDREKEEATGGNRGSEWNQAGTWEERDTTSWVKERLSARLQGASVQKAAATLPSGKAATVSAEVTKVKSISGDAQIVTVRKQPRFGYNFEAELSFRIAVREQESADEEMPAAAGEGEAAKADEDMPPSKKAPSQRFDGTLSIPELADFVQIQDLRFEGRWKGNGPPENLKPIVSEWLQKLQESVREQVKAFLGEYHAL